MNSFEPINAAGIKPAVYQSTGIRMQCTGIDMTTKACLCKVSAEGVASPTEVPHTAGAISKTLTPLYVYEEGSFETSGTDTFANFSVLGAAGIVKLTASAGETIALGDTLELDANGYVRKATNGATTEIQIGIALEAVTTTTDLASILVESYCPVYVTGGVD